MMALAVRDPFYLAVVDEERSHADDPAALERACLRCHAPAGHEESGGSLRLDEVLAGDSPSARIGREGVTCTMCHQIADRGLGTEASLSGGFEIDYGRAIFGPHAAPDPDPMMFFVNYVPTEASHITQAELCASCHTVIVGGVVEQATYLEWRASEFATDQPCQTCHVPTVDEDDNVIIGPIAKYPPGLNPRQPYGRHLFVGGNAYMLRLIAANEAWAQTGVPASELAAAAQRAEAHLATAATLRVTELSPTGFRITIDNQTGHKLPTGYPSRRMWLRVRVVSGGATVWTSGEVDATGRLADDADDLRAHRDVIDDPTQVQVWQLVLTGDDGQATHRATAARSVGRDDRIPPRGFAPAGQDIARTAVVGVTADPDFGPGQDGVRYQLPALAAGASVTVELMYQTLSPSLVETLDLGRTPSSTRFVDMARAQPPLPVIMTSLQFTLPDAASGR